MTSFPVVPLLDAFIRTVPMLAAGVTALLIVGCAAAAISRAPIHRQRIGELTILGVLAWNVLAFVALPRPLALEKLRDFWSGAAFTVAGPALPIDGRPVEEQPVAPNGARPAVTRPMAVSVGKLPEAPLRGMSIEAEAAAVEHRSPAPAIGDAVRGVVIGEPPRTKIPPPFAHAASQSVSALPESPTPQVQLHLADQAAAWSAFDWRRVVAGCYFGGCVVCAAWLAFGWWLLARIVWTARTPEEWLRQVFASLAGANDAGRIGRTRLIVSPHYPRAMSFGVLRPTIVLPAAECRPENAARLRHVLLHEVAHVRRRDAWGNLLFNLAFPILYVHPCFWWLRSRARSSAELVADEWAAGHSSRDDYARELVAFARACRRPALGPAGSMGILDSSDGFLRRIEMLIQREQPLATTSSRRWRIASLAGFAIVISLAVASGGRSAQADPQAERAAKAVQERLQAIERQRDALRAEVNALRDQLKVLESSAGANSAPKPDPASRHRSESPVDANSRATDEQTIANIVEALRAHGVSDAQIAENALQAKLIAAHRKLAHDSERRAAKSSTPAMTFAGGMTKESLPNSSPDLVAIATTFSDAIEEAEEAKEQAARMHQLHNRMAVDESAASAAAHRARKAERKLRLLRAIITNLRDIAAAEAESARRHFDSGDQPAESVVKAQSRVKMLQLILAEDLGSPANRPDQDVREKILQKIKKGDSEPSIKTLIDEYQEEFQRKR